MKNRKVDPKIHAKKQKIINGTKKAAGTIVAVCAIIPTVLKVVKKNK